MHTKLTAQDGKVFKRVSDGTVFGTIICLGKEDSPENYIEIYAAEEDGDGQLDSLGQN